MGFINNYQDNFLPSGNPWANDNVTVYNVGNSKKSAKKKVSVESFNCKNLDYDTLKDMHSQLSSAIAILPDCPKKVKMRHRLMLVEDELAKRDKLEDIARKERDDNFEIPKKEIKEDVPQVKKSSPSDAVRIQKELYDLTMNDLEDCYLPEPPPQQAGLGGANNFLLISIVVLVLIAMKK
tara:strand:+ start:77 stop:616 length:540 start_codon:yes stop_codon:yes gene_type:complete